ncbi:MAG: hypothetical protein A2046_01445 [Bacteroidetes bacterium GWA2_30_7]|nr:MAG: hypothetical protein A2046_01445 [Bacteroidetes bacterium GWA2_30_7]
MKKFKVALTRDYIIEINAKNEKEAKECSEFFISYGIDVSTNQEQKQYNFKIEKIKPITNNAFEIEEI